MPTREANMTLRPDGYRDRLIDLAVEAALGAFGAVSLEGPVWCGKTWTSLNRAESVFYVADPAGGYANRALAGLDPAGTLRGAEPRLIDEWQEVPPLWDAVRFEVDRASKTGRFLLSGSSRLRREESIHSGAGRIARLRMRPMSLFESGDSDGACSLGAVVGGSALEAASAGARPPRSPYASASPSCGGCTWSRRSPRGPPTSAPRPACGPAPNASWPIRRRRRPPR
ncbi:MAG: AAA family ATPase [Bifidobacteriaceae bacterium]|jgi:hypothetical protein|nr:AAA family ATPase [Bifidobacteriaceae bacterium]